MQNIGRVLGLNVGLALLAAGCAEQQRTQCNPLEAAPAPITLGEVIVAGRSDAGTVYVIEQPNEAPELRAFASSGDVLVRHVVAGSGVDNREDGSLHYNLLVDTAANGFTLIAEVEGDHKRMLLASGSLPKQLDIDPAQGEELEIVGEDVLEKLTLRNLPDDVHVEYWASLPDGARMLVVRPEHDWSYEQFRLFLGPLDRMQEREVFEVTRAKDGGSTHILFDLGSRRADVFFPHRLDGMGGVIDGPVTLDDGSSTLELTLDDSQNELGDASFVCLP